jgi:hypothetical protein
VRAGKVADTVRDFYEHHPYPPPVDDLDRYRKLWDNPLRRRADACLFWSDISYREDRSVLVAGCGTSQAAKYALRWPRAKVTGTGGEGARFGLLLHHDDGEREFAYDRH